MSTVPPISVESQRSENPPGISPGNPGLILIQSNSSKCTTPNRPFLKGVNQSTRQVILFQPDCKTWACPHCAEIRAARWRTRALRGVMAFQDTGTPIDFVTVTSHENLGASASLSVLGSAWKKLHWRIGAAADRADYYLVPEFHQDGRVHLHLLTTAMLKKKWWKDNARSCGFGYQSDVQEVAALGSVAAYVTKYLGKMLQKTNLPKHFRRVRTSRGWPKLPDLPENPDWRFSLVPREATLQAEQVHYQVLGYTVVVTDSSTAWDWIETGGWI